ncbi:MAG TPA: hypothetical protein H9743_02370 [Candidatus Mediterraneibacter vanvlietii]|nr:hypothetical protein [Candidatus Mediterraneibacter vanvlietii]
MIRLDDTYMKNSPMQSSKGNQFKWERNGIWYKADYTGYEGLAEYMVSGLLSYSNLKNMEFIQYQTEEIGYKKALYRGCKSLNFLPDGWQLITLERLFKNLYGQSLYQSLYRIEGVEERARFLVEQVELMTGLKEFGPYLSRLLTIDALFLNEDRHMHNIAVLYDDAGRYHYCPVFDNGSALLSDTTADYPMGEDIISLIPQVKAKTLSSDFMEQLDVAEDLYGQNLYFTYDEGIINELLAKEEYYPDDIKVRIKEVLLQQRRTYSYLFRKTETV